MKLLKKVWGIGLVIVLLVSLVLSVAPASAATLAWSGVIIPNDTGITNQVVPGVNTDILKVAPNGDLFAVDITTGDIYKSTNGGRSWTVVTPTLAATANIVDLAISPAYATDRQVFFVAEDIAGTGDSQVYISSNAGANYSVLGGTIADQATSLAVAPNYSAGVGEIMVGTVDPSAAAAYGSVYIWNYLGTMNWTNTTLGADTVAVAYSPNYAIDSTRVAVASIAAGAAGGAGNGTALHTKIGSAAWDTSFPTLGNPISDIDPGVGDWLGAGAEDIRAASIAFPANFNGSLVMNRTLFVSILTDTNASADVYRVGLASAAPAVSLDPMGIFGLASITTSIVFNGDYATGKLYAGYEGTVLGSVVMTSANPSAAAGAVSWYPGMTAPTGTNDTTIVLSPNYASNNTMYVATTGGESAVSVSTDGGVTFQGAGLIDTAAAAPIDIAVISSTDMYLVTSDGATTNDSLWKTTDGGTSWYRMAIVGTGTNTSFVRLSPDNSTLLFAEGGGTAVRMTSDGGLTWTDRAAPVAGIADIAMKDQYTWYVADDAFARIYATSNGGWTWGPPTTIAGTAINDIALDIETGHILAANDAAGVYISTNNNATYTAVGIAFAVDQLVAFDANYAENKTIYAAGNVAGDNQISRWVIDGGYLVWLAIKASDGAGSMAGDIISAPDGTLYITEAGIAGDGIMRTLNPTAGTSTANRTTWNATVNTGLGAVALGPMSLITGSNIFYAIDTTTPSVRTYTDTLTQAIPVVTGPAEGAKIVRTAVIVTFDLVPGALSHDVQWSTRPDFIGAAAPANVLWPNNSQLLAIGAGLDGVTIYYRVRVNTPVLGPWSETRTVETQLIVAAPNAPVPQGAVEGGTNNGGWNASLNPTFQWQTVGGATAYEFQLSKNNTFTDLIVDATGGNAFGNVTAFVLSNQTLSYDTSYFWRVRAISATSTTEWSPAIAFTTMEEAVEPTATGPAPTQPAVTQTSIVVTQPVTTQVIEETAPAYIWAIIVVGAILVIAVIVLIVRTRRSV